MKKLLSFCALALLFACTETPEAETSDTITAVTEVKSKGKSAISEGELAQFPENAQLIYRHNQNLQVMEKTQAEKLFMEECTKLLTKKGISVSGLTNHEIITKVLTLKN